jgi:hypothetical protein
LEDNLLEVEISSIFDVDSIFEEEEKVVKFSQSWIKGYNI